MSGGSPCIQVFANTNLKERLFIKEKDFGVQTLHLSSNPKRVAPMVYHALVYEAYDTNCYK
ncbi:MAG: hypothetical protein KBT06_07045, partial [Prevotellaceae bacterium]|nr:hypothetical protein [Candidatus Colivivens equi]